MTGNVAAVRDRKQVSVKYSEEAWGQHKAGEFRIHKWGEYRFLYFVYPWTQRAGLTCVPQHGCGLKLNEAGQPYFSICFFSDWSIWPVYSTAFVWLVQDCFHSNSIKLHGMVAPYDRPDQSISPIKVDKCLWRNQRGPQVLVCNRAWSLISYAETWK